MKQPKILGIIGGMGSYAAVSLFRQIIEACPAKKDQEFIEILLHNNSQIPDRTEALLNQGEDAFPQILRSFRILHEQGADYITMGCITAHSYVERLRQAIPEANIIDLFEVVSDYLQIHHPEVKRVGVLASSGTVNLNLWPKQLAKKQIKAIQLKKDEQERYFTSAVYGENGIKSGHTEAPRALLLQGAALLQAQGADSILSACSELPMVLQAGHFSVPFIDCLDILVKHIITLYYPAVVSTY